MLAIHSRNLGGVSEHVFQVFTTLQHPFTHQFTPLFTPPHRPDPVRREPALGAPTRDRGSPDSAPPTSRPLVCAAGHHSTPSTAFSCDLRALETRKDGRGCRSGALCWSGSAPASHTPRAERIGPGPWRHRPREPGLRGRPHSARAGWVLPHLKLQKGQFFRQKVTEMAKRFHGSRAALS